MKKILFLMVAFSILQMMCVERGFTQMINYNKIKNKQQVEQVPVKEVLPASIPKVEKESLYGYSKKVVKESKTTEQVGEGKNQDINENVNKDVGIDKGSIGSDFLVSQPKVSSSMEMIYDVNQDRVLQKEELQTFLKDVLSSVERRGSFDARSEILQTFDNNKDRRINKEESQKISLILNDYAY